MLIIIEVEGSLFKEKVEQALKILDSFFVEACDLYCNAFENVDDNYFTGLNVFKHD
ncbi:hypothetical protein ACSZMY_07000 [Aeromonas hydrophila]